MLETAIVNLLINQQKYTELDQAKIRYGVRIIVSELYKFVLIYGIALLLGSVLPTFVTHMTFYVLRQKAFGYHFASARSCIFWSIVAFPVLSGLLVAFPQPLWLVGIIGTLSVMVIFLFAPVDTEKHQIVNKKHYLYLRRHLRIRLLAVLFVFCVVSEPIQSFIILGLFIQSTTVLVQKLMRRDVR
ncbi:accessory gene regulator ArgB-like protein [Sporosarcina obsidiansis]|uniref:accessory gene regulator ArgB-like protein n=1 Tax=Sporosarcina obsidiansis TaxID=2660748 RepID=UPI00129BCA51|nr:accessory gene regulator B family protein [Sporosarcina obsidiansis]